MKTYGNFENLKCLFSDKKRVGGLSSVMLAARR